MEKHDHATIDDSIEEEIKSLHDELENVKIIGYRSGCFAPSMVKID